jgi:hypothetical protein
MRNSLLGIIIVLLVWGCHSTKHAEKVALKAAEKAGAADTSKPSQVVNLPVFIPIEQLQKQLYTLYFEPNYGRFYPCDGKSDCSDLYKDLYVEKPMLKVRDDLIAITMHVDGNANALVFHPQVQGDITLTAKPIVKNDTLYFSNVKMEKGSQNFLLSVASVLFEKKIVNTIQQSAWYNFRPTLDTYTHDFQKQLPLKWESSVLLLNLRRIYLNNVVTLKEPNEGILANFSLELVSESPGFGQ